MLRENKKSMLFIAVFFVLSPRVLLGAREEIWGFQVFLSFPRTELRAKGSSREWDLGSVRKHNSQMKRGKKSYTIRLPIFPFSFTALCPQGRISVDFEFDAVQWDSHPFVVSVEDQIDPEIISDINESVRVYWSPSKQASQPILHCSSSHQALVCFQYLKMISFFHFFLSPSFPRLCSALLHQD